MTTPSTITDATTEAPNVNLNPTYDYGEVEIDGQTRKIDENYLRTPEIQQLVADCKARAKRGFKDSMELFELLEKVQRTKAYLAEPGPDGKPLYRIFEAFLINGVGLTHADYSEMRKAHDGWIWANATLPQQDVERLTKNSFFFTQLGRIPANMRTDAIKELLDAKDKLNGSDLVRWRKANLLLNRPDGRDAEAMSTVHTITISDAQALGDGEQEPDELESDTSVNALFDFGDTSSQEDSETEDDAADGDDDADERFIIGNENVARDYVGIIVSLLTSDSLAHFVATENGYLEAGKKSMAQKLNDAMEVFQQNLAAATTDNEHQTTEE